jgi:hypothetical protein
MTVPTQEQLDDPTIPHVTFTSDMLWDPAKYDDPIMTDQVAEVVDNDKETVITPTLILNMTKPIQAIWLNKEMFSLTNYFKRESMTLVLIVWTNLNLCQNQYAPTLTTCFRVGEYYTSDDSSMPVHLPSKENMA